MWEQALLLLQQNWEVVAAVIGGLGWKFWPQVSGLVTSLLGKLKPGKSAAGKPDGAELTPRRHAINGVLQAVEYCKLHGDVDTARRLADLMPKLAIVEEAKLPSRYEVTND